MAKTKLGTFAKRVLAALVMLPLTIGIIYAGYPFVDIFVLVVGAIMSWEWARMTTKKDHDIYVLCYSLALVSATMIYNTVMTVVAIALLTAFVWLRAKDDKHRWLITLGVPYISVGVGSLLWIYYAIGFWGTLWFFLMVWGVDIGGYIVGSNLKGPKLAPRISPNKTWSGLIGGIILSVTFSIAYIAILNRMAGQVQDFHDQLFYAGIGALIAIIAQCGDLIESAIKRSVNVKDSSNLIPGHGGMFDRIDGLIFAAPFVYMFFSVCLKLF